MNYRTAPLLSSKQADEARREEIFGPPPVNVFKQLRQDREWSHDQLARRILISKQALIRLEQGTWAQPLPTVVDYWVKNHGVNELMILDAYEFFRSQMRVRYRKLFGDQLVIMTAADLHPFRQLRDPCNLNPSEIAKMLCIPQATIQYFERKWKQQKTVPKELSKALHDIGYTNAQISRFESDYTDWRRSMLGKVYWD